MTKRQVTQQLTYGEPEFLSVSNSFHGWSVIVSVTSVLLMKLSIVQMLIAHPVSGKACLGRGSLMRGQTTLLSPILQVTGHALSTSVTLPLRQQLAG